MKLKSNRFAVIPVLCTDCQRYIWLESYRHGEIWHYFADRSIKVNICRDCYKNYTFGKEYNNE